MGLLPADGSLYAKGKVMATILRIIGLSLLTSVLGAGLGFAIFGKYPDWTGISLLLTCVGGIIGAAAGVAREIVTALRRGPSN
jgi:hypothetical protein